MALTEYGKKLIELLKALDKDEFKDILYTIPVKQRKHAIWHFRQAAKDVERVLLKCEHPKDKIHVPYEGREECTLCGAHRRYSSLESIDPENYEGTMWGAGYSWSKWEIT